MANQNDARVIPLGPPPSGMGRPAAAVTGPGLADGPGWAGVRPLEAGASDPRVIPVGGGGGPALGPVGGGLAFEAARLARLLAVVADIQRVGGVSLGAIADLLEDQSVAAREGATGSLAELLGSVDPAALFDLGIDGTRPASWQTAPADPFAAWTNPDDPYGLYGSSGPPGGGVGVDRLALLSAPGGGLPHIQHGRADKPANVPAPPPPSPNPPDRGETQPGGSGVMDPLHKAMAFQMWLDNRMGNAGGDPDVVPPWETEPRRGGTNPPGFGPTEQPLPDGEGAVGPAAARLLARLGMPIVSWPRTPSGGGRRVRPGHEPDSTGVPPSAARLIPVSLDDAPARVPGRSAYGAWRGPWHLRSAMWGGHGPRPVDPSRASALLAELIEMGS